MDYQSERPRAQSVCKVLLVVAVACVFVFTSRWHEFWRDELQAANIAHAIPLRDLLSVMRTEAVPPIFYVSLEGLLGLPVPYSLSVMAPIGYASLLGGTYLLLETLSGSATRSLVATVLLAVTDTYFYELGVMVRPYGLGLGFAFACIAFLDRALQSGARRDAAWGALFGALAVSTVVHSGSVAGAALLTYTVLRLLRDRTPRAIAEPLYALPAFLFTFFLLGPYDRSPIGLAERHPPLFDAMEVAGRDFADGLVSHGWWSNPDVAYQYDALRLVARAGIVLALLGLLAWRFRDLDRSRTRTVFYAGTLTLNVAALLYVFIVRYEGSYRHHLFLFMPILVVGLGVALQPRFDGKRDGAVRLGLACLAAPWLWQQYVECFRDVGGDYREAFGVAKGAAVALPPGARAVIAGEDWMAAGIVYYRPDVALRATSSMGRPIRYQILDWHWRDVVPLVPLLNEECTKAGSMPIYVIARDDAPKEIAACARFVAAPPTLLPTERFRIYELPCDCPALR